jgi:hypothetical protein
VKAPVGGNGQSIRGRIWEQTQLSPEDYRGVAIQLFATLGTGATSGSDSYRVPSTHELSIKQIVGHIALIDVFNEVRDVGPAAGPTLGISDQSGATAALSFLGRVAAKAMNCAVDLQNQDRTQKVIDNHPMSLATILTLIGGRPLDWSESPHLVPAGETLLLNVALLQTTGLDVAKIIGGNTQYGITLIGDLIRTAKS